MQSQVQQQQPLQQHELRQQLQAQQTWSEVVRRRKKPQQPADRQPRSAIDKIALLRRRAPKTMAVIIDRPAEGGSLASVMKKVLGSINLQSLGVKVLTTKKTRAGGILLEVVGNEKATLLAGKIRKVVGDAARVRLPEPQLRWKRGSLHLPLKDAITLAEKKAVTADVALISDPYPTSNAWHASAGQRKAVIYVANTGITVANVISDPEFVSVRLNGVLVYSCYASPNRPIEDFQDLLRRFEDGIRTVQQEFPVLVTGDLNARSAVWGDWVNNKRGEELELLIESLGLVITNSGLTPTFLRGAGSIVDVTLSCDSLAARITDWRVLESVFNNSDHHYIRFSLTLGRDQDRATLATTVAPRAWNTTGGVANDYFLAGLILAEGLEQGGLQDWQDAERGASAIRSRVSAARDFAFPARRTPNPRKPPVHWWNADIEALSADCTRAKRRMTRMTARVSRRRQTHEFDEERADAELANGAYREAKRQLKIAIQRSKRTYWKELISSVDADPFSKPYKLVMRKLRGLPPTASMEYATLQSVVDTLFPKHQARTDGPLVPTDPVVPFTASEVDSAVERAGSKNKALARTDSPARYSGRCTRRTRTSCWTCITAASRVGPFLRNGRHPGRCC
ncbi:hypothetical protein QTP88_010220 [Uroleucon formosanum]